MQTLNTAPLIATVIKLAPIAKENIMLHFCEKNSNVLLTTNFNYVTYTLVITDIGGTKCRVLIDTGVGASRASSTFSDRTNKKPIRKQYKRIETRMNSATESITVYSVEIRYSDSEFKFQI